MVQGIAAVYKIGWLIQHKTQKSGMQEFKVGYIERLGLMSHKIKHGPRNVYANRFIATSCCRQEQIASSTANIYQQRFRPKAIVLEHLEFRPGIKTPFLLVACHKLRVNKLLPPVQGFIK